MDGADADDEWTVPVSKSDPYFVGAFVCLQREHTMAQLQMDHYNKIALIHLNVFSLSLALSPPILYIVFLFLLYRQLSMAACCLLFLVRFWLIWLDNYRIRSFILFGHCEWKRTGVRNSHHSIDSVIWFFFSRLSADRINRSHSSFRMWFDCFGSDSHTFLSHIDTKMDLAACEPHLYVSRELVRLCKVKFSRMVNKKQVLFYATFIRFIQLSSCFRFILCKWNHVNHVTL